MDVLNNLKEMFYKTISDESLVLDTVEDFDYFHLIINKLNTHLWSKNQVIISVPKRFFIKGVIYEYSNEYKDNRVLFYSEELTSYWNLLTENLKPLNRLISDISSYVEETLYPYYYEEFKSYFENDVQSKYFEFLNKYESDWVQISIVNLVMASPFMDKNSKHTKEVSEELLRLIDILNERSVEDLNKIESQEVLTEEFNQVMSRLFEKRNVREEFFDTNKVRKNYPEFYKAKEA